MKIKHAIAERGNDLYETPPEAVVALMDNYAFPPGVIWEPACGPGSIARTLRAMGREVFASDLIDYQSPDQNNAGLDFLSPDLQFQASCIITNPPYKIANEFVRLAIERAPVVAMLMRLTFIESRRRAGILDTGNLECVLPFANRLPNMHRHGWDGPKISSTVAYAWFIWNRNHSGPTRLQRIFHSRSTNK